MESLTDGAHALLAIVDSHHHVTVKGVVARAEDGSATVKWEGDGDGDAGGKGDEGGKGKEAGERRRRLNGDV